MYQHIVGCSLMNSFNPKMKISLKKVFDTPDGLQLNLIELFQIVT